MKYILFLLLFISVFANAQKKLPVVKANTTRAALYEGNNPPVSWTVSPEIRQDIHITNKITEPVTIKFKTDIDAIAFTLKAGQRKDFIVLLNGKDSCYTSVRAPEKKDFSRIKPEIHDTIPFLINEHNTFYVKGVLNSADTLNLNFDTGATEMSVTNAALKTKVKSAPKLYHTVHELKLGNSIFKTKVYDTELSGHETDGRFGWDLFDGMIVELDYDKNLMIIHSRLPASVKKKDWAKLNIKYFNYRFLTEASISQNGQSATDWFLFDSGYERAVMLDNDLLKRSGFPTEKMKEISRRMMYGAKGNEIPIITANLESLTLGGYKLNTIPAQVMTTAKTLFGSDVHILGNEVLKRFTIFLDFQDNAVYLKPNSHFNDVYIQDK